MMAPVLDGVWQEPEMGGETSGGVSFSALAFFNLGQPIWKI